MFLPIAYHNGLLQPLAEVTISGMDLSIHRGYSIFDFFKYSADYQYVDWYFDRFYGSAERMGLRVPYTRSELKSICDQLLNENNQVECFIKLLLSAGYSENGFLIAGEPTFIAMAAPYRRLSDTLYRDGARLISARYVRDIPEVKTTNYLYAASKQVELKKQNAIDILYHDGHGISECARSNVFFVKEDQIVTPDRGILYGITRKKVLSIKDIPLPVVERPVEFSEIEDSTEVFITSTVKRVMPIVEIDDITIGDGSIGPVTAWLMNHPIFA